MIVDPGPGGVLSCVLERETTVRNQTLNQETEEQETESDKQKQADNKSDPEGTIKERNNPRKNNFSTNPGNFPEHYIFPTQIH